MVGQVAVETNTDELLAFGDFSHREVLIRDVAVDAALAVLAGRHQLSERFGLIDLDVERLDSGLGDGGLRRLYLGGRDARLVVLDRDTDHLLERLATLGLGQPVDRLERSVRLAHDVHDAGHEPLKQTRAALHQADILSCHLTPLFCIWLAHHSYEIHEPQACRNAIQKAIADVKYRIKLGFCQWLNTKKIAKISYFLSQSTNQKVSEFWRSPTLAQSDYHRPRAA